MLRIFLVDIVARGNREIFHPYDDARKCEVPKLFDLLDLKFGVLHIRDDGLDFLDEFAGEVSAWLL